MGWSLKDQMALGGGREGEAADVGDKGTPEMRGEKWLVSGSQEHSFF